MWAGPVASATADTQPRAASPSPARVKFYVVPPPGNGHAESLFTIAAETLGDGRQFMEIFRLNKGRLQPNGGRLTNPRIIEPGWILQLPSDAAGPEVQFGPLPVVTPPTSPRPSRPGGAGSATMISEALLAFVVAGLVVRLIRRRADPSLSRLRVVVTEASAHDWEGARRPSGREMSVRMANPTLPDAGHQAPGIRHQAPTEAAAIRQAAERQAAERDAAELRASPAAKPPGRPRQYRAMRLAVLAVTIPILFGLIAATTELALHGYGYFVFRSAGTGATQQGPSGPPPSQPPAARHRRHARRGQVRPPCASSPGSETARATRTN